MSNTDTLNEIYRLMQLNAATIFPELGFKRISNGWEATCGDVRGVEAAGHIYYYDNFPPGFKNHKTGDVIKVWDYVKETLGLTENREIFKSLADMAGYNLPDFTPYSEEEKKNKAEGRALVESFLELTRGDIWNERGRDTLDYCRQRGYSDDDIRAMGLGHNPGYEATMEYLVSQEWTTEQVNMELKYLPYRNEYPLIIGQMGPDGRSLYIWGRRIRPAPEGVKKKGKYLPITDAKGSKSIPFNLHNIKGCKTVVGVEGFFDWLFSSHKGLEGVIGWGQAVPSSSQIDTLKRMGIKNVIFVPDNDEAGRDGVERGLILSAENSISGFVAELPPDCKDLDEFVREHGVDAAREIIHNAKSGARWKGERITGRYNIETDIGTQNVLDEVMKVESTLKNPIDRQQLIEGVRVGMGVSESILNTLIDENRARREDLEMKRRITDLGNQLVRKVGEESTGDILNFIRELPSRYYITTLEEPVPLNPDLVMEHIINSPEGIVTGYPTLDRYGRINVPSLNVIGARSGHGKTTFAINLVRKMLGAQENSEVPFIFFSLEVPETLFLCKLLGAETGIPYDEILKEIRVERLRKEVTEALDKYRKEGRLFLVAERGQTVEKVSSYCRGVKREYGGLGAVFVDYIGLLVPKGGGDNTEQQYAKTITGLSDIAHELEIPVFALSQMNRESAKNQSKEVRHRYPRPDQLRWSGQIEQDADRIMGLFNHTYDESIQQIEAADKDDMTSSINYQRPSAAQVALLSLKDRYGAGFNPIQFRMEHGVRMEEWVTNENTFTGIYNAADGEAPF